MRLTCLFLHLFAFLSLSPAYGQRKAKVDTVAAFRAFSEGARLEKAAKYDSAITAFKLAAEGYKSYALSLPDKKKYALTRKRAWEQHFIAQANIGWSLNAKGQGDSALKLLLATYDVCSLLVKNPNMVTATIANNIGVVSLYQGKYDQALDFHQQALAIRRQSGGEQHPNVAASYNNIGNVYQIQGLYQQALDYHQQALAIRKQAFGEMNPDVTASYNNIGNAYNGLGLYTQALKFYQKDAQITTKLMGEKHLFVASSLGNIGSVYRIQGRYEEALQYQLKALDIQRQILGEQHPKVASSYSSIGLVLSDLGQFELALKYQQQALTIRRQLLGERHPAMAISYLNIGILYADQDKNADALQYFQQALEINKQVLGEEHPEVAGNKALIGNVLFNQDRNSQALIHLHQSLATFKRTYGEQHPEVANRYSDIGNVYAQIVHYDSAYHYYQHALRAYLPDYKTRRYQSLATLSPNILKSTLLYFPKFLLLRHQPGDDTLTISTVRFADSFIDSLRWAYTYENDKLELGTNAHQVYQVAIDVAKWNDQDEEAFYYSEKNKAAVLAQSLNEAIALKLGGIPDSLLEKDKELRLQVAFYTKAIIEEELNCPKCDSSKLITIRNTLFNYQQQYKALKAELESDFPQYFALKYKDAKISVKEVQHGFLAENPNSAILEYLLGDSVLYAFCITKDKYSFNRQRLDTTRFKKTNALQLEVKKLARALGDPKLFLDPTTTVSKSASALYDYLIKPFEQQIQGKDLVIIPDAELNKIPFEMLIKPSPNLMNVQKWQELPYLIKQHNISYHYSARLLLDDWQKSQSQPVKSSGFIAFAPVFNDSATGQIVSNESSIQQSYLAYASRGDTLTRSFTNDGKFITPLPGTEREVKAIYELFSQQNQPAKYYLNDQANEATVKSLNLKPYKYLHFATHGLTDEDRPTNSCLILAQKKYPLPSPSGEGPGVGKSAPNPTPNPSPNAEGSTIPDNLLTSSEMYGLELDAELVVLSACQTGKGTLKAGEGIIGLTRGLLYAGARNLLVSQWNVNDASTAELMMKFYAKILAGQSNRQALREAKLELLNSKFACPHYWSAFVLVGR